MSGPIELGAAIEAERVYPTPEYVYIVMHKYDQGGWHPGNSGHASYDAAREAAVRETHPNIKAFRVVRVPLPSADTLLSEV